MGDEGFPRAIENNAYANFWGDKRGVLWNSASREYAFQECTDLVTLVIMCSLMLSELVRTFTNKPRRRGVLP